MQYDLIVIGGQPCGEEAALAASRLKKRVAVIEPDWSDTGRSWFPPFEPTHLQPQAVRRLVGTRGLRANADCNQAERRATMKALRHAVIAGRRSDTVRRQQARAEHSIDFYPGQPRLLTANEIEIQGPRGQTIVSGDTILLAVGSRAVRPNDLPLDATCVVNTEDILAMDALPRSLIVAGGARAGLECACLFAALGVVVTIVDPHELLLDVGDHEITRAFLSHCQSAGMRVELGDEVIGIERGQEDRLAVQLDSGARLSCDSVLMNTGGYGNTDGLNLDAAGLEADERGRIWCNDSGQTWVDHIYAAGDVVGYPARARDCLQGGRRAIRHAFGKQIANADCLAFRLCSIPQIVMVGKTEQQLAADKVAYKVGIARVGELAPMLGHRDSQPGMLRLLFHAATHELLGMHCLGEFAADIAEVSPAWVSAGNQFDITRLGSSPVVAALTAAADDGFSKRAFGLSGHPQLFSSTPLLSACRETSKLMIS